MPLGHRNKEAFCVIEWGEGWAGADQGPLFDEDATEHGWKVLSLHLFNTGKTRGRTGQYGSVTLQLGSCPP